MIEIFKTNASNKEESQLIISAIKVLHPEGKINIDMHDCDKILRIESQEIHSSTIKHIVQELGFICEILM